MIPVRLDDLPGRRRGRRHRRGGRDELARGTGAGHHRRADRRRARRLRPRARRRGGRRAAVLRGHRRGRGAHDEPPAPRRAGRAGGGARPARPPDPADPDPAAAPAVALFFELVTASDARWDRSDRTVQAVAELCRAVDGLPLAIELAAARARTLSPTELLELVTQRTDTLRPPGGARSGGPPSIDSSIALSVGLLDDDQRDVFRRLGVLTGGFDLGLVHAVAGPVVDDHLRAVELVGALVDRSLVVAEPSATSTTLPDARGRARARARRPDRRGPRGGDPRAPGVGDGRRGDRHPRRGQPAVVRRAHRAHHHPRRQLHRLAGVVHRARRRPRPRLRPLRPAVRARPAEGRGRAGDRVRPLRPVAGDPGAPPRRSAGGERHRPRPRVRPRCRRRRWPRPPSPTPTARRSPPCWRSGRSPWPPSAGTTPPSALEHARRGRAAAAAVPMPPFERELRGFEAALVDRER